MKRIAIALPISLLLLGLAIGPATASDRTKFDALIAKYAPFNSSTFKPKGACVCLNTSAPGYLVRVASAGGLLACVTPTFDADGKLAGSNGCSPYAVLGK